MLSTRDKFKLTLKKWWYLEEIWHDVVDYEGLYKISNLGDVFSYYSNRILSPGTTRDGYKYVFLFKNKKKNYTQYTV